MLGVVFIRRLREGKTFADFREAWYPEIGFGVPTRVISGAALSDAREIVTIGFVDAEPADLEKLGDALLESEATRHTHIDEVIETTEIRTFFVVEGDDDFTQAPRPIGGNERGFPWAGGSPAT